MKRAFITICLAIMGLCPDLHAQKLKSAAIYFSTPSGDDKDWDTRVTVSLYTLSGTLVGRTDGNTCNGASNPADIKKCFCCNNPGTQFTNGSDKGPFTINISNSVDKKDLGYGVFVVSISPNGNDRWIFVPRLVLEFEGDSPVKYQNYDRTIVSQDAQQAMFVFPKKF